MDLLFPEVESIRRLLRPLQCDWWVAGGWAVDMFLGRQTRAHQDLEIALARADQVQLLALPGVAGLEYLEGGEKHRWRGQWLELPMHELHARFSTGEFVEVLLNEFVGEHWVYRRNRDIRLPRAAFDGAMHLPIEVVLLYKSKSPRAWDEHDFHSVLPRLDAEQRRWLAEAIALDSPAHPWLQQLRTGGAA